MPMKGTLRTGRPYTITVRAPADNKGLVIVDITRTSAPLPGGTPRAEAGAASQTYRTAATHDEFMTLRIRVEAGDEAEIEVTRDGATVTSEWAIGGSIQVSGYVAE